jgi:eukaryotic-like serine/threonine-protein kinase
VPHVRPADGAARASGSDRLRSGCTETLVGPVSHKLSAPAPDPAAGRAPAARRPRRPLGTRAALGGCLLLLGTGALAGCGSGSSASDAVPKSTPEITPPTDTSAERAAVQTTSTTTTSTGSTGSTSEGSAAPSGGEAGKGESGEEAKTGGSAAGGTAGGTAGGAAPEEKPASAEAPSNAGSAEAPSASGGTLGAGGVSGTGGANAP